VRYFIGLFNIIFVVRMADGTCGGFYGCYFITLYWTPLKSSHNKKYLGCVGRGVLRFWSARYRKSRSNLGLKSKSDANSGIGGVDIIWVGCVG